VIRFSVVVCLILDVVTQISKANLTGKGIAELVFLLMINLFGKNRKNDQRKCPLSYHKQFFNLS
jgi:hypothetical protein